MKRKNFTLTGVLALMLAMMVTSCSKVPKYAKLIPEDATIVMRMDVKKGFEQAGLDENNALSQELKDMMKDSGANKKQAKKMADIMERPAELGVDLREPLLCYFDMDNGSVVDAAMTGSIHDKALFIDALETLFADEGMPEFKEKGTYKYMKWGDAGLVVGDDWFYYGIDKNGREETDEAFADNIIKRFEGADKGTMLESSCMKDLCECNGIVQCLFQGSGLEDMSPELRNTMRMAPYSLPMDEISMIYNFDADGSDITMTAQVVTESDEWKELIAKNDKFCNAINSDLMQYVSRDGLACFIDMDMKGVLEQSEEQLKKVMKEMDKDVADMIQSALESIDGEAAFCLTEVNTEYQYPVFAAYMKVNNDGLAKIMDEALTNNGVEKSKSNAFTIPLAYERHENEYGWYERDTTKPVAFMEIGSEDGLVYAVGDKSPKIKQKAKNAFSASDTKGSGFYAFVSGAFINGQLTGETEMVKTIKKFVGLMDYAEFYYEGNGKTVLRIAGKDKATKLLAAIINMTQDAVQSFNSSSYSDYDYSYEDADTILFDEEIDSVVAEWEE